MAGLIISDDSLLGGTVCYWPLATDECNSHDQLRTRQHWVRSLEQRWGVVPCNLVSVCGPTEELCGPVLNAGEVVGLWPNPAVMRPSLEFWIFVLTRNENWYQTIGRSLGNCIYPYIRQRRQEEEESQHEIELTQIDYVQKINSGTARGKSDP